MTNEQIASLIANGTREGNGTMINVGTEGGKMYIPDNINPRESSLVYFYDSEPSINSYGMKNQITSNRYNKITIFLGSGDNKHNEQYLELINSVARYKGVNNTVTHSMGASAGSANGLHMKIDAIKKNNERNQTVVVLECAYNGGYGYDGSNGNLNITAEDINVLKNSNSSLLFIEEIYRENGEKPQNLESNAPYLQDVAKAGVPVIVAHYAGGNLHMKVVDEFTINSNILDYLDGKADLTGIGNFTFSYCDKTGTWHHNKSFTEAVTYSGKTASNFVASYVDDETVEGTVISNADFSSLNTNYSHLKNLAYAPNGTLFSSLIKSDENYTIYSVGEISTLISATGFLNGITNNAYQSTTNIPREEDYAIHKYFTVTGDLLEFISQELTNILTTANIITETDNRLTEEANNPDNISNVNATNSNYYSGSGSTNSSQLSNNISNAEVTPTQTNNSNIPSGGTTSNTSVSNNQTSNDLVSNDSPTQMPSTQSPQSTPTTETTNQSSQTSQPIASNPTDVETSFENIPSNNDPAPKSDISPSETSTPNTETTPPTTNENTSSSSETTSFSAIDTNNTTAQSSKIKHGFNPLKAIFGAAALGGAGYGGKKIYDKAKKIKEDEEE